MTYTKARLLSAQIRMHATDHINTAVTHCCGELIPRYERIENFNCYVTPGCFFDTL